ncbi:amidase signature domain-containing protein [Scheffersomyces amazonensis]|uniref:amidase signature domain-containing protein n=1 Tax=Scheffersomyces amazonensis TaxID=1078765 RepID=UPI00315CF117
MVMGMRTSMSMSMHMRMSRRGLTAVRAYGTLTNKSCDRTNSVIWRCDDSDSDSVGSGSGVLSGTSFIVKDNIATKVGYTTAASKSLHDYQSPFDATVVRLLRHQGSKLVGKANLDEFGMGSSTTNSMFGPTINPKYDNEDRIAGGSSGGSAAAVAADMASFSLGTDTGGSVRLPASYCGVVGFKPTYGRISRWGVIPYAQTLDTVGILSKDVDIVEKVYEVLNQYDEKDPTCMTTKVRNNIVSTAKGQLTIGIPEQFIIEELDQDTKIAWELTLHKLVQLGHSLKVVSIPSIKKSLSTYYTLATAEAASNLSRYDGIRYGYKSDNNNEDDTIVSSRCESFGQEVQRRIILGNYTLSSESGDHYLKAAQVRQELVQEFNQVFKLPHPLLENELKLNNCDVLVSPTALSKPPTLKEYDEKNEENFLNSYLNDILTVPASLAGLPTISIPINGTGIQFMTQYGDDSILFSIARDVLHS